MSDISCNLNDSIVVWSNDIIKKCQFKYISFNDLQSDYQIKSERNQLLWLHMGFEQNCNLVNTEGLYIASLVMWGVETSINYLIVNLYIW